MLNRKTRLAKPAPKPARCPRCGSKLIALAACAACPLRVTLTPTARRVVAGRRPLPVRPAGLTAGGTNPHPRPAPRDEPMGATTPALTPAELAALGDVVTAVNARPPGGAAVWLTAHVSTTGRPVVTVHTHAGEREYRHPGDA